MRIRTLIVVLLVFLSPTASANVVLSGYIGFLVSGSDESDSDNATDDDGVNDGPRSPGSPTFSSDISSVNLAVRQPIGNGLSAYGNYRIDGGLSGSSTLADNIWVGIRGGFGDVRIGEVPDASQFGQLTGSILPASSVGGEIEGISYRGFFGPVNFGANFSPVNNSDRRAIGARITLRGLSLGLGIAQQGSLEGNTVESTAGLSFALQGVSYAISIKDFDSGRHIAGAKLGYGIAGVSLSLTYEQEVGDDDRTGDRALRLDVNYFIGGGILLSGRINQFLDDSNPENDLLSYRMQFGKTF